jgi:insertion element IS1 protein InsB
VEFYILAAIHLAILCVYSFVLVLVIMCLDYLSAYFPDFTHFTLHSRIYVGSRDENSANKCLWASLPAIYRQCAVAYTDFWAAYALVIPANRHRPLGKETGHTAYIERLNCTLRQRVGRLVRKTLSFSKNLENHIGAIFFFARHYNSSLPL